MRKVQEKCYCLLKCFELSTYYENNKIKKTSLLKNEQPYNLLIG